LEILSDKNRCMGFIQEDIAAIRAGGIITVPRRRVVGFGRRNYGDHDKGLAPLSLCESR
jgi:hypothetical protein